VRSRLVIIVVIYRLEAFVVPLETIFFHNTAGQSATFQECKKYFLVIEMLDSSNLLPWETDDDRVT